MVLLLKRYAEYLDIDRILLSLPDSIPLAALSEYFLSSLTNLIRHNKKMNWQKESMEHYFRLHHDFPTLVNIPTEIICNDCGQLLHSQNDQLFDPFVILWQKNHVEFKHDPACPTIK